MLLQNFSFNLNPIFFLPLHTEKDGILLNNTHTLNVISIPLYPREPGLAIWGDGHSPGFISYPLQLVLFCVAYERNP